jgi:hypothetical protein
MVRSVESFVKDGKVRLRSKGQKLKLWVRRRYEAHVDMLEEPKQGTEAG